MCRVDEALRDRLANWHCQTPSVRAAIMQLGIVSNQRQTSPSELTDRWKKRPLRSEMAVDQDTSPTTEGPHVQATDSHLDPQRRRRLLRSAWRRDPASRAVRVQPTDRLRARPQAGATTRRPARRPGGAAALEEENRRLRQEIADLRRDAENSIRCDKAVQRRLTTTAFAMGLSTRQIEELLGLLLPADAVPDHSTLGHWVQAEATRATAVLATLDPACAPRVTTLALDEIFFGGDRP